MTWPNPDANALDRARAIARTYRDALTAANPQRAAILDHAARRVGEGWVCDAITGEQACTVSEAALMLGVSDSRVRQLIGSGALRSEGKTATGHVIYISAILRYNRSRSVAAGGQSANALTSDASG